MIEQYLPPEIIRERIINGTIFGASVITYLSILVLSHSETKYDPQLMYVASMGATINLLLSATSLALNSPEMKNITSKF